VQGNLTGFFQYRDMNFADPGPLNDYFYRNDSNLRDSVRFRAYEVSYLHRFNPNWALLTFFSYRSQDDHLFTQFNFPLDPDFFLRIDVNDFFDWEFHNLQVQQQLILGKHTLFAGFDYFYGPPRLTINVAQSLRFQDQIFPLEPTSLYYRPVEKTYSFYLLDYWRLTPWLLVELGLFRDVTRNVRGANPLQPFSNSLWSPWFGLNIQINPKHTLRLAAMRYLNTHVVLQPLVVPTEVAGLSWPEDTKQGAEVRKIGASWEAQWNPKTFTVLRLEASRVSSPEYLNTTGGFTHSAWVTWRRYQASLFLNRILTNSLGLTLGVTGKRFIPDESLRDPLTFGTSGIHRPLEAFTEVNGLLDLSFLTPKGWQGGVRTRLVYQYLRNRSSDNLFALVDLRFGKELPNKRGLVTIEVENLFNRHFDYLREPSPVLGLYPFFPARRIIGRIQLWF